MRHLLLAFWLMNQRAAAPPSHARAVAQRYVQMCKDYYGPGPMRAEDVIEELWELHVIPEAQRQLEAEEAAREA